MAFLRGGRDVGSVGLGGLFVVGDTRALPVPWDDVMVWRTARAVVEFVCCIPRPLRMSAVGWVDVWRCETYMAAWYDMMRVYNGVIVYGDGGVA